MIKEGLQLGLMSGRKMITLGTDGYLSKKNGDVVQIYKVLSFLALVIVKLMCFSTIQTPVGPFIGLVGYPVKVLDYYYYY